MARDLPIKEEVEGNNTAALEEGQFELCHYPLSMIDSEEIAPAFFDETRAFDLIILDTTHHPLSYGITIPDWGEHVLTRIGRLEALLTDGLLPQLPAEATAVNGTASASHLARNSTLRLATALWNVTSALWNISDDAVASQTLHLRHQCHPPHGRSGRHYPLPLPRPG